MQHSDNMNGVAVIIYMKTVDPKEIIISVSPEAHLPHDHGIPKNVSAAKHYGRLGHGGPKT